MASQIIAAIIGVFSVILGTIIGGFISFFTNKNIKIKEWRLSLIKEDLNSRKKLYSDFLGEANRLILFSLEEKASSVRGLDSLINYFSQIELVATEEVIEQAKKLADCVIACNTQSTTQQDQHFYHLKKYFIEAVKHELSQLRDN